MHHFNMLALGYDFSIRHQIVFIVSVMNVEEIGNCFNIL